MLKKRTKQLLAWMLSLIMLCSTSGMTVIASTVVPEVKNTVSRTGETVLGGGTQNDTGQSDPALTEPFADTSGDTNPGGQTENYESKSSVPTYTQVTSAMEALRTKYPEGMPWDNYRPYGSKGDKGSAYVWHGGWILNNIRSGVGCAAFAFILSDAAFGDLQARVVDNVRFEDVKVGDILRINGNTHSVIVLQKSAGGVIIAEGNYNSTVHWGRALSVDQVEAADFVVTRYPEGHTENANADEKLTSGQEGGLDWTLTKGGTLTISGSGAMPDSFTAETRPAWETEAKTAGGNILSVIIDEGITNISDYAFYKSSALDVHIPSTVTSIGQNAFSGSKLLNVTLSESVQSIGNSAFQNCLNLVSASVAKGLVEIGDNAFYGCTSLTHMDFPSTVKTIGSGAFMGCKAMVSVRFAPGSEAVSIGETSNGIFAQCQNLTSVILPEKLTMICDSMFASCTVLSYLYIPKSVVKIGSGAFNSTRIVSQGTIEFGGTEAEWDQLFALTADKMQLLNATIKCNVEFDNPFAQDPNAPKDMVEEDPCKDGHIGTADENGNCSVCGQPITPEPVPVVHEHSWSTAWATDAEAHWHECEAENCDITDNSQKDSYAPHVFGDLVVDTAATATQDGSGHRDCSCGYQKTETIPATGENSGDSGSSGDSGNMGTGSGGSSGSGSTGGSSSGSTGGSSSGGSWYPGSSGGSWYPGGSSSSGGSSGSGSTGTEPGNNTNPENPDNTNTSGQPDKPSTPPAETPDVPGNSNVSTETPATDTETDTKKPVDITKVTKQLKTSLRSKMKTNMKKQLTPLVKKQVKTQLKKELSSRTKRTKAQIKARIKKKIESQLKTKLKDSTNTAMKKQMKKEFIQDLGDKFTKVFTSQFNSAYNSLYKEQFHTLYNTQFNKLYKQLKK